MTVCQRMTPWGIWTISGTTLIPVGPSRWQCLSPEFVGTVPCHSLKPVFPAPKKPDFGPTLPVILAEPINNFYIKYLEQKNP